MTDNSTISFGKHKGKPLSLVPPDYLIWLYENKIAKGELKEYIEKNLPSLQEEAERITGYIPPARTMRRENHKEWQAKSKKLWKSKLPR